jgi:hypothetical protein
VDEPGFGGQFILQKRDSASTVQRVSAPGGFIQFQPDCERALFCDRLQFGAFAGWREKTGRQ